jgi:predicted NBD/HSP70 family sugar kinase
MLHLGIDIGGSSVKLAAIREGQVLWTEQSASYDKPTSQQLIQAIRMTAGGRVVRAAGVGMCVPGIFDKSSRSVTLSVNIPGLNGLKLDSLLQAALGDGLGPLRIVTDSVATAFDIWSTRKLAGRLLLVALGTGVGAAVLDDGKMLSVDGDTPGHLGQVDVSLDDHPPIGPDGGAGSLEAYVGGPALTRHFGRDLAAALPKLKGDEPPFRALARAIRIAHAMYRPHHVCLAGGIGVRLAHVLPRLRELVEDRLTNIARPGWTFTTGDSDFHAALGAARLAANAPC